MKSHKTQKILKYDLTPQEKIDLKRNQLKTIQNPVITIPINTSNSVSKIKSCGLETETIWVSCSEGVHNSSNINDWAKCRADTPPRVYTVSKIKCIDAEGSTGGDNFPLNGGLVAEAAIILLITQLHKPIPKNITKVFLLQ